MVNLRLPRLSQTMSEGTVAQWLRAEGDEVAEGDFIVIVESDKANVEIQATAAGRLQIIAAKGSTVPVDGLLARILAEGESASAAPSPGATRPVTKSEPDRSIARPAKESQAAARTRTTGGVKASPVARRIAKELGVDLTGIRGTGPGGVVSKDDVQRAAEEAVTSGERQSEFGAEEWIPLQGIRKIIADKLTISHQTVAAVTTVMDVNMSELVMLRDSVPTSYTAFIAKATAQSLTEFPYVNASLIDDHIVLKEYVNLGVAVAVEDGLIVPVIRAADKKDLQSITQELQELAALAREGNIKPEHLGGGTFTITNSGVFGSLLFTPLINYPEAAILGLGKVYEAPVVRDGQLAVGRVMHMCLTYDHRIIDGAVAVRFLSQIKEQLEQPSSI